MRRPAPETWLAAVLGSSGVLHLVRPRTYEWLVPPELGSSRTWVLATGVAELGAAALLATPATRRAGGGLAAALLTAFVPAHLHTFRVIPRRAAAGTRRRGPAAAAGAAGRRRSPGGPWPLISGGERRPVR